MTTEFIEVIHCNCCGTSNLIHASYEHRDINYEPSLIVNPNLTFECFFDQYHICSDCKDEGWTYGQLSWVDDTINVFFNYNTRKYITLYVPNQH